MSAETLLSQELVDRIANLKVRAKGAVEGLRSGVHRSPHRGASVIFAEHRDYRPGDDTRLLDWRAFARNDRYTVKHFEQETHLRAQLLLDLSPSMAYGAGASEKAGYGATLLSALGLVLLRQGDAVGAMAITDQVVETLPSRARGDHLDALLAFLARTPTPGARTQLQQALLQVGERLGKRGLLALASDLIDSDPEALRPLSLLRARGHEVWVFHILHPDEIDFPFDDSARFFDPESKEELDADPRAVRAAYKARIQEFIDGRQAQCVAAGCRYILARSDLPAQQVLAGALGQRGGA